MVGVFDVFLNCLKIERWDNFVSYNSNTYLAHINEVCHDFQLDVFQSSVEVSNINTEWLYELCFIIITHKNNDLFSRGTFCHHIYFRLWLILLLIILWMLSILFASSFRKVFLIFKILLVLGDKACVYNFLVSFFSVGLVSFLKNLDISMTSLEVFAEISRGNFTNLMGLLVDLSLLEVVLVSCIFGVNLDITCCLNVLFSLLVTSEF